MKILEQFDRYLEIEEGRLPGTRVGYLSDLERFRAWLDEQRDPPAWEEITPNIVRAYFTHLSSEREIKTKNGNRRKLKKVGARYIRRAHAALSKFFEYLVRVEKSRVTNPLEDIKKPRLPKRNPEALNAQEISQLINLALEESRVSERTRNWAVIAILFHTGLRIHELCNMRTSDIIYREGVPQTLKVIGKGNKERTIALNEEASRALNFWLRNVRRQIVADLPPDKDAGYVWLIPSGKSKGNPVQPQALRVMLRRFGKMSGLHVHPHKLRASFATEAIRNGAKIHALQKIMGHEDGKTTLSYAHADTQEIETVVAVLPRVMGKTGLEEPVQPVNNPKDDEAMLKYLLTNLTAEQKSKLLAKVTS
jgi:integrase/recombinase XerD